MSNMIKALVFGALGLPLLAGATQTASETPTLAETSTPTILEIEQIQAQTVIYEAQLVRDRAHSELQQLGQTHSGGSGLDISISKRGGDITTPLLLEVFGTPRRLKARLKVNGEEQIVNAGSSVRGTTYRVMTLTREGVTLDNGTHKIQLYVQG